jgi:predicted AAA+ superfamily ATPase
MINRANNLQFKQWMFRGKVLILIGSRQVGKTTLISEISKNFAQEDVLFVNCDESDVRAVLENSSSTALKAFIGSKKLFIIDEAQRVKGIGLTLKLIADTLKEVQVIATGSSAFDLRNELEEPLTGRKIVIELFPISTQEMVQHTSYLEEKRMLEQRMIYGMYPEIINNPTDAKKLLKELSDSYLFKDILSYKDVRQPDALRKLLTALSLQVGSEVSYNEIGNLIGLDKETVERYIDLLEKSFVVFRLTSLSRNGRNELKKSRKIYFYDNGVRNAVINNFNPLSLRADVGDLWENFMISERRKTLHYNQIFANTYFWRTHTQQEIDYIEEREGKLFTYEFKWSEKKKAKLPKLFTELYPENEFELINSKNYMENFVLV